MSRTLGVPHIKMLSYTAIIIKNVAGCMILDHNGIVTLSSVMIFASRNGQSIEVYSQHDRARPDKGKRSCGRLL